jgi:hypothetical protein
MKATWQRSPLHQGGGVATSCLERNLCYVAVRMLIYEPSRIAGNV